MKKILYVLVIFVLSLFLIGTVCYAENEPVEEEQQEEQQEQDEKIEVAEIIEGVVSALNKEEDKSFWELVKDYFSAETITVISSIIALVIGLLKAIGTIKKLKIDKELTLENVRDELKKQLGDETQEQINKALVEITKPIAEQVNSIIPTLGTFGKVLALSQENTPTSRLAILELLTNTNQVEVQVVEQAKESVEKQVEEEELKKEEQIELLEKIEMPVE